MNRYLEKGAEATRTYQPRSGGINKNSDLYPTELLECMQYSCERFIKYFDYCTINDGKERPANPTSFFTYNLTDPYQGDFKLAEYREMNKIHRDWILENPEETRKIEKNSRKLFPEENHVGKFFSMELGLRIMKAYGEVTVLKKNPASGGSS